MKDLIQRLFIAWKLPVSIVIRIFADSESVVPKLVVGFGGKSVRFRQLTCSASSGLVDYENLISSRQINILISIHTPRMECDCNFTGTVNLAQVTMQCLSGQISRVGAVIHSR